MVKNMAYISHAWGVHTLACEAPPAEGCSRVYKEGGQAACQGLGVRVSSSHSMTFWHRISRSSQFEPITVEYEDRTYFI